MEALRDALQFRFEYVSSPWANIFTALHKDFAKLPLDELTLDPDELQDHYKPEILSNLSMNRLFDRWAVRLYVR